MTKYGIEISYSWGEREPIHGNYDTKIEAYEEACKLAAREAYVQNEEFVPEHDNCTVTFNASLYEIDLFYAYDDTKCFYRIVEIEK